MNDEINGGKKPVLTKSLIILMTIACGVCVANLYYVQPLESQIARAFHVSQNSAGIATMLTQIGYACGILFIVPLGDMCERRSLIMRMLLVVILALVIIAFSPNYLIMVGFMFILGITTAVPQIIVPYAAHLSPPGQQGKVIGDVMSGLLVGILLSRAFSGIVGAAFNWRVVYVLAAIMVGILFIFIARLFPSDRQISESTYTKLLKSIPKLVKTQVSLRESAVNGFFMFGSFTIFWTSLIFLLETPVYNMGTREAGLLGLVGMVGALAAPLIGKVADERGPRFSVGIGVLLSTLAYVCFSIFGYDIWGLIAGAIILDFGNQCGQVSNQARVQLLGDKMRSRNNTVFMFSYFMGGAVGSFLGTLCWQNFKWQGVCAIGIAFQAAAIIAHFIIYRPRKALNV